MSETALPASVVDTRPPDSTLAAALPMDPRDGLATAITGEYETVSSLVSGSLTSTVAAVALPAVASTLLMTLFATVDAFWVGTRIGPQGLAAVSTSIFWVWMLISCAEMVSVGLTAIAARRHGERLHHAAARAVSDGLFLSIAIAIALATLGLSHLDTLFAVMHTPPEVTALGKSYLGTYLLGAPLIFGFFAIDAAFRSAGDTHTPFLLLLGCVIAALALDPVLILGLGPAPRLGIAGAAVATVFTRSVAFLVGIVILMRRRMVTFGAPSLETIRAIVRVGLPTAVTGVVFSNIYVFLTRTTTKFGTPALAALGVGHRVESWSYMVGVGFGAAAAAIVGQNLGARQVDRAARAAWIATGFAMAIGLVAAIGEYSLATSFARLFTSDPLVIAESARYLRIGAISTLFAGAELVLEGALGGAGDTLPPMLTSTTLTALRIPLAAWAATRWGTSGIWWTISLTALGRGVAMMVLWKWGRWKRVVWATPTP
ncbi:MAG: MATE family efflux transporter [Gemmatimonas sp.]|nr:MATE family efflux transporter [Gemmatimonadaceae bacterium]